PLLVGLEQFFDFGFELANLLVEDADDLLDVSEDATRRSGFTMILLDRSQLDELTSAQDQSLEFPLFFRRILDGPRPKGLPEAGQHPRVDAIGFRLGAESPGEVANAFGI